MNEIKITNKTNFSLIGDQHRFKIEEIDANALGLIITTKHGVTERTVLNKKDLGFLRDILISACNHGRIK